MQISVLLIKRFSDALQRCSFAGQVDDIGHFAAMIRPAGNPTFGDYQANFAMPIAKQLAGGNPREIAAEVLEHAQLDDLCETPEIGGPGFINLVLNDRFLLDSLTKMLSDPRSLVERVAQPRRILIDYSSPNVAKPMHVGHIRTTVIGDCLAKTLDFLGHQVITDNHLGDWGTQFGIIIYGYKHFGDAATVERDPVPELAKLYRIVHQLMGYHNAKDELPKLHTELQQLESMRAQAIADAADSTDAKEAKKKEKLAESLAKKIAATYESIASANATISVTDDDPVMRQRAADHAGIRKAVLDETSKLHAGDAENLALWTRFLPHCQDEIDRIYSRLNISFDHTLGESFYHPMLSEIVDDLTNRGLATRSDGAVCIFMDQFDAPMIIQKSDGAYLYATTDLATLRYRQQTFHPNEVLYVVDARQSDHFEKLFAVAEKVGLIDAKLVHVSFGTVLGDDGRPMKTRSGTLIGLESLLDDAVDAAYQVVCDPERVMKFDPPMEESEQRMISERVGIGAIKYADLSHDRTSDYKFNLAKMVALTGNTATYAQYNYARTIGILRRVGVTESQIADLVAETGLHFSHPAERALGLQLLRFEEALQSVYEDYRPNHLIDYIYSTAETFSRFNDQCHVMNAESTTIQNTRLTLVLLTSRVLQRALWLVGIDVVERM